MSIKIYSPKQVIDMEYIGKSSYTLPSMMGIYPFQLGDYKSEEPLPVYSELKWMPDWVRSNWSDILDRNDLAAFRLMAVTTLMAMETNCEVSELGDFNCLLSDRAYRHTGMNWKHFTVVIDGTYGPGFLSLLAPNGESISERLMTSSKYIELDDVKMHCTIELEKSRDDLMIYDQETSKHIKFLIMIALNPRILKEPEELRSLFTKYVV